MSPEFPNFPETRFPWEGVANAIQGGSRGIVFDRTHPDGSYRTAFVEVSGDGIGFIRAEGSSIEKAEAKAWEYAQRILACSRHDYDPRGYTNGIGRCKHCNHVSRHAFTAEQLGLTCHVCDKPTYGKTASGKTMCILHHPGRVHYVFMRQLESALEESPGSLFQDDDSLEEEWFQAMRRFTTAQ